MGSWKAAQREGEHCLPFTNLPCGTPALSHQHQIDCRGKGRDPTNPTAGPTFGNQTVTTIYNDQICKVILGYKF